MEALNNVVQELLVELERSGTLKSEQTDKLLTRAISELRLKPIGHNATREKAQSYLEILREAVKGRRRRQR